MYKWRSLQHASCALPLLFFFPFENRVPKWPKNEVNSFVNNLVTTCEIFENLLFHQFPILMVISRKCDIKIEKWDYITGQVRAGFCWITKKSKIILQLKIFFTRIIFVWTFFKDANFVIFSADFLIVKFERIS